jgi:probable phosphoglycerate mutase
MELTLIRHGLTTWNQQRVLQGQLDVPLSSLGRWQAERLAARMAGEPPPDLFVSSDLARARETALPIATARGLRLELTPALRERCFGIYEGRPWDEVQEEIERARIDAGASPDEYQPPNGESRRQVEQRVERFLAEVVAAHPAGRAWVVSHGGVIRLMLNRLLGPANPVQSGFQVRNTGVSLLRRTGERWEGVRLNCTRHLEGVEPPAEGVPAPFVTEF